MIYTVNILLTLMALVLIGAIMLCGLAARNERKRDEQQHQLNLRRAEKAAEVTEVQRQILAKHYRPEMEIIFAQALIHDIDDPAYLTHLERFRENYPEAHQLWVRLRGLDATLDSHVRSNQTLGLIEP